MKITIEGCSQDLTYTELSSKLNNIRKHKIIDININGLKFKGRITGYSYQRHPRNGWEILKIQVITIEEQIKDLYIGVNEDEI